MINSLCPRPIGISESITLSPVCIGSLTGWRKITPGAFLSIGSIWEVLISPLPSIGSPRALTTLPRSSLPTGTEAIFPVRFTKSPSFTSLSLPNKITPTLSSSRLSTIPKTPLGNSTNSETIALVNPYTLATPSPT